jgi:hypothetical protein
MGGTWVPFLLAVGVVSVIWYRWQNRPGRRWSSDTGGGDVSYSSDGGGSNFSIGDWFGSSPSDIAGNSADPIGNSDSGGSDSGGSGDSGSGGDGGGSGD